MQVVNLHLSQLRQAPWNPNQMDDLMLNKLGESLRRFGIVENLVVRPLGDDSYEVLSGNHRLRLLIELGFATASCVVLDLDDAHARLLSQALNHIGGEDDLGLRAELLREVLKDLPEEDVLSLLPETSESLQALSSLGLEEMAEYLDNWQRAQAARLKHMQFQLTPAQLPVVEEALERISPMARQSQDGNPNLRGTALFILCKAFLEKDGTS